MRLHVTQPDPAADAPSALQSDFEHAARAAGGAVDRHVRIAGQPVCLRFAGETPASLLSAAFAHLSAPTAIAPSLTLHVWDSTPPGIGRPTFAPPRDRAVTLSDTGPGASCFFENEDFRALHQPAPDLLSVLTNDGATGWFWMPDATALPHWDYAAPFRHLLSWWLASVGAQHVHGGAIGTEAGGLLLVGAGGSGKSTTALTTLRDDRLRYAGDDYVAVSTAGDPTVFSLYCSGKVHRPNLHRVPHLRDALANGDRSDEKAIVFVDPAFAGRAIEGFPLRAIVLPTITDRTQPRAVPTTGAAALAALAPSTIFQLHPPAREALSRMADLVRAVPAFVLELGSDVEAVPDELVRLLDSLD